MDQNELFYQIGYELKGFRNESDVVKTKVYNLSKRMISLICGLDAPECQYNEDLYNDSIKYVIKMLEI